jgi:hypothetical protein
MSIAIAMMLRERRHVKIAPIVQQQKECHESNRQTGDTGSAGARTSVRYKNRPA